jgi:uncharacterized protein (DUF488 family)
VQTASFFSPGLDLTDTRCVSIARSAPRGYRGRRCDVLAPTWPMIRLAKAGDFDGYREQYVQILHTLNAADVVARLRAVVGDAILLCWEPAGQFCHRRLVAEWIEHETGLVVPEWTSVEAKP